jgi:hypothetical protein
LSPGESSEIGIEINSLTQAEGDNHWRFVVHAKLDLPGQTTRTESKPILVTAHLVREIVLAPPSVAFSTTGEASQIIRITDRRAGSTLKLMGATSTSPHLKTDVLPDGTLKIALLATALADGKTYSETVTLTTNDPVYASFRIPVSYVKRNAITLSVSPERFAIRLADGETQKSAVVQLRDPSGQTIAIASATCTAAGVTTTFSKGSNPIAAVRVTVDTATAGASGTSDVVIAMSNGSSVTVPLTWGK